MKYIYNNIKKKLKLYKKFEFYWFIFKWIKKNSILSKKEKNLILHNLEKKINFKYFSITQFHKICHQTWRSKTVITPFSVSKTLIKSYANQGFISGLKRI